MVENAERPQPGHAASWRRRLRRRLRPLAPALKDYDDGGIVFSDYDLNPHAPRPATALLAAAVLTPLVDRPGGLTVLFTRRTDHLRNHAGQISFPGGRVDRTDATLLETALRETEEEIGLDRRYVETIGLLDPYETVTGYRITPVVGLVSPELPLAPDPAEVAEVFEVPLTFLLAPGHHQVRETERGGIRRAFFVFDYGPYTIWGATAGMLMNLYRRLTS